MAKSVTWKLYRSSSDPCKEMTRADGYVMARRPRCTPFVISASYWDKLPDAQPIKKVKP